MTCRHEILDIAITLTAARSPKTFTVQEVFDGLRVKGTVYAVSTIRTHIASIMCINAPAGHLTRYPDLKRVGRGLYELL
jgi:hypothetical protein